MESRPLVVAASLATILIVLVPALPGVRGIMCYQCNSKIDPGCTDVPPPGNTTGRYYRECDENGDGQQPFCRKAIIKVLGANEGRGEERVVRSCGWMRSKNECYQYDDDDHHELVCQCFTDGCNGAFRPAAALPAAAVAVAVAFALPRLWR